MENKYSSMLEAMSAYCCLGKNILMNHRQDLTKTQLEVMLTLRYGGPASITELSRFIAVSNEQASRATSPLVERGLVEKARKNKEHRKIEILLTEEGEAFLDGLEGTFLEDVSKGFDLLSVEERERLVSLSTEVSALLWKAIKGLYD